VADELGSSRNASRIKLTTLVRVSSLEGIYLGLGVEAEGVASAGGAAGTSDFSAPVPGLLVAQLRKISSNWKDSVNYIR
jgi:hypothetical protein